MLQTHSSMGPWHHGSIVAWNVPVKFFVDNVLGTLEEVGRWGNSFPTFINFFYRLKNVAPFASFSGLMQGSKGSNVFLNLYKVLKKGV